MIIERWRYLIDFWNWVDIGANFLIVTYLVAFAMDTIEEYRSVVIAYGCFFVYLRLIGFYRINGGTRRYIRMLRVITWKIRYFILILVTFVLSISFSLKALRENERYTVYWMVSFRLMMGDFEDDYPDAPERILFTIGCLVLPIIALNLLIAIIGDAFDDVQEKAVQADVRERLELIKEVGKFIFWDRKKDLCYIHWVSTPLLRDGEEESWLGKVKELKNFIATKIIPSVEQREELAKLKEANTNDQALLEKYAKEIIELKKEITREKAHNSKVTEMATKLASEDRSKDSTSNSGRL